MKYIDAEKLKSEIERLISATKSMKPTFDQFWAGQISAFKGVIKIATSLQQEQPEVDLEKEIDEKWDEFVSSEGERDDFTRITRYFYELGLKARK